MSADIRIPSLAALARRYGSNPWRQLLLRKLRATLAELRTLGFRGDIYVGGSFTTRKRLPGDIDLVLDCATMPEDQWPAFARSVMGEWARWDAHGVSVHLTHPDVPADVRDVLRRDRRGRARQLVVVPA